MWKINTNTTEESKEILQNLITHNIKCVPELKDTTLNFSLNIKDESGKIVAGILGEQIWNWVEVSILWVDESHRKHGFGLALLQEVEELAQKAGCIYIRLDTFHFQALGFYQKNGYEVFGKIAHPLEDLTHYFLVKYF